MNSAEIAKKAVEYHDSSLNCAQSVLCALSDEIRLDEETAKLIAAGGICGYEGIAWFQCTGTDEQLAKVKAAGFKDAFITEVK